MDHKTIQILQRLLQKIYNTGFIPSQLKQSLFIRIPKKVNALQCSEHRTISLMSHVIKVLLKIIIRRNKGTINREVGETQSGFREKMGTREGLLNFRLIVDKYQEVNKNICVCFIDYEKAFDRVYHQNLMEILKAQEIDGKDLKLLQNLYWQQMATIKLDETEESKEFPIQRGVRQGCVISPQLFNLYTEMIFRHADTLKGINIGGRNITNLRFADDTALMAENEEELQKIVDMVKEKSLMLGLKMNVKKTKTMMIHREKSDTRPVLNIKVDGSTLEQVSKFVYLGQLITEDGKCEEEIKRRIGMARTNFINMRDVLASRKLTLNTRKRLIRCYILSTFLYASETWSFSKESLQRIDAFEMWLFRRMLRISYEERRTNEDVMRMAQAHRALKKDIMKRKAEYFGHIIRKDNIQKMLIEGKVEGKRPRGRPRRGWTSDIKEWVGMSYPKCKTIAMDRKEWHRVTEDLQVGEATRR